MKKTKESRSLLIAMTVGDGSIVKHKYGEATLSIGHTDSQLEYINWKE